MTTSSHSVPTADAVVITAPDGCTTYLLRAIERSLDDMDPGAVLDVPCNPTDRIDIAEWCLAAGKRVLDPWADVGHVFSENTQAPSAIAA